MFIHMRVADFIIEYIYQQGTDHVFMIAGGGAMFLNDAVISHKKMKYICHHHEQAAAMAAEAYAKTKNQIGVAMVTSGPGSTNAITGLLEAWQNSIPCLFLSSQTKRSQMISFTNGLSLRQFGVQEVDIIPVIKSLTKYAAIVTKPEDIKYHLEKAYTLALSGRPGPVWLDIPSDVAGSSIDSTDITGFRDDKNKYQNPKATDQEINYVIKAIRSSKKPVIIAGGGIRLAKAVNEFKRLTQLLKIPVVSPLMGSDLLDFNIPFMGHGGTKGQRIANIIMQNSDLLISIGSRLAVPFIGHEYDKFAPDAKKIVVDIDVQEHKKKTIKIDLFINSDAKYFIQQLLEKAKNKNNDIHKLWLDKCQQLKKRYSIYLPKVKTDDKFINMYYAIDAISRASDKGDIFVFDAGTTAYASGQNLRLKEKQRAIIPGATLTMGYNFPAIIGIWAAQPKSRIICITGDGSFQMNIHELQTIVHHKIPAKIFVVNNQGYLAIRTTQKNFFQGRLIGESIRSGVSFPDTKKIAQAYGIKFIRIDNYSQLDKTIQKVVSFQGTVICEIVCPMWQDILTVSSKKLPDGQMVSLPIDDMYPFLPDKELTKIRELLS